MTPPRLFGGLWTTPLADDAPLETDPAKNGTVNGGTPYATRLANQANYTPTSTPVAGYYTSGYNTVIQQGAPLYIIPPGPHPTRKVWVMTNNGAGPEADDRWAAGLRTHFLDVPIPVAPNGGRFEPYYGRDISYTSGDKHLIIYRPETGELWEMWLFSYNANADRYEMAYGGYTANVATAPEAYPNNWGARATSLPLVGGLMLNTEYAEGEFRHPLTVSIPVVKDGFLAPATRQDGWLNAACAGNDTRDGVPEGAWFRLPAGYPIPASKSRMWQMIVMAARDYGIIVSDQTGGTVTMNVEAPFPINTPYSSLKAKTFPDTGSSGGQFWGSGDVLLTFPWRDLVQVHHA